MRHPFDNTYSHVTDGEVTVDYHSRVAWAEIGQVHGLLTAMHTSKY